MVVIENDACWYKFKKKLMSFVPVLEGFLKMKIFRALASRPKQQSFFETRFSSRRTVNLIQKQKSTGVFPEGSHQNYSGSAR